MAIKNVFSQEVTDELVARIQSLHKDTVPQWGKMSVDQMLAHCCVPYEYVYTPHKYKKPNAFVRFILKSFVKNGVVNEVAYKRDVRTAPDFIIKDNKDFEAEKNRLIGFLQQTCNDGPTVFDGKESHSFGTLTLTEWNNMFYKHLDHHLTQFGV